MTEPLLSITDLHVQLPTSVGMLHAVRVLTLG